MVSLLSWTLWASLALAQPAPEAPAQTQGAEAPTPEEEPDAPAEDEPIDRFEGAPEVIVYPDFLVEQARRELISRAKADGFIREIRKDDRTILRHEDPWKGDLVLYDNGYVDLKRQPVRFEPPFAKKSPAAWLSCVIVPLCIRAGGQALSKRKWLGVQRRALVNVEPEIRDWNERISDAAINRKVDGLPARLDRLWTRGDALDGTEVYETWEEKRAAVLEFWDSRVENAWGEEVRAAVEAWVRGVVQTSEHPYTVEEQLAFEARRMATRPFPFERRATP